MTGLLWFLSGVALTAGALIVSALADDGLCPRCRADLPDDDDLAALQERVAAAVRQERPQLLPAPPTVVDLGPPPALELCRSCGHTEVQHDLGGRCLAWGCSCSTSNLAAEVRAAAAAEAEGGEVPC